MGFVDPAEFRVEKARTDAVVTLSNGLEVVGHFFVSQASPVTSGPERVAELLNSEPGFFPFELYETGGAHTVLFNRDHVLTVAVPSDEARRDPGYAVATARTVSLLLSDGRRILGSVRVYRPEGHDRLSDWARHGERFRYIETSDTTFIVNVNHIVEAREVFER
jgi:hypothetical protein